MATSLEDRNAVFSLPDENPSGMKFCDECAARLARACPACGASSRPELNFAVSCALHPQLDRAYEV